MRGAGRYAHQGTTVFKLTKLPSSSQRKVGYKDSGWTFYEECSSEQIKKFFMYDAEWKLVLDLGAGIEVEAVRGWPVGPDDFDEQVDNKTFTNGADKETVKKLYRKMSVKQLGGIKELDFDGMQPPSLKDAQQLGGCLNLCTNLETLDLSTCGLTDDTIQAMVSVLKDKTFNVKKLV